MAGWYYVVDDAEPVSAERIGTTLYHVLDRNRRGVERVSPGTGEIGGDGLHVVVCLREEIAGLL